MANGLWFRHGVICSLAELLTRTACPATLVAHMRHLTSRWEALSSVGRSVLDQGKVICGDGRAGACDANFALAIGNGDVSQSKIRPRGCTGNCGSLVRAAKAFGVELPAGGTAL
jgi:hypothetical protein